MIYTKKTFKINGVKFGFVKNPKNSKHQMIEIITHGLSIKKGKRKEVCRIFLRNNGWKEKDFGETITNVLEVKVSNKLNDNSSITDIIIPDEDFAKLIEVSRNSITPEDKEIYQTPCEKRSW